MRRAPPSTDARLFWIGVRILRHPARPGKCRRSHVSWRGNATARTVRAAADGSLMGRSGRLWNGCRPIAGRVQGEV